MVDSLGLANRPSYTAQLSLPQLVGSTVSQIFRHTLLMHTAPATHESAPVGLQVGRPASVTVEPASVLTEPPQSQAPKPVPSALHC